MKFLLYLVCCFELYTISCIQWQPYYFLHFLVPISVERIVTTSHRIDSGWFVVHYIPVGFTFWMSCWKVSISVASGIGSSLAVKQVSSYGCWGSYNWIFQICLCAYGFQLFQVFSYNLLVRFCLQFRLYLLILLRSSWNKIFPVYIWDCILFVVDGKAFGISVVFYWAIDTIWKQETSGTIVCIFSHMWQMILNEDLDCKVAKNWHLKNALDSVCIS
jgi:hypothetical protein